MYKNSKTSLEIGLETVKAPGTEKARLIKDYLIFRNGIFSAHVISELNYHNNFLTVLPKIKFGVGQTIIYSKFALHFMRKLF